MRWPLNFVVHSFPIGNKVTKVKKKKAPEWHVERTPISYREGACGCVYVDVLGKSPGELSLLG